MFKSLKIGWEATNIGERIETSTSFLVDSLILENINVKTHDTIYIFSQIFSLVTHNMYGKLLNEKGQSFLNDLDVRLKFDEKNWLTKILRIPLDITSTKSIDVFFDVELDGFRDEWISDYVSMRREDPNASAGKYTYDCIANYFVEELDVSLSDINDVESRLESHLCKLDELTK